MNKRPRISPQLIPLLATAGVLFALYLLGCLNYRNFATARVFVDLLGDNAFLGVAAIGATIVILSGGIDLSVGAVVAFISTFIASMVEHHHVAPLLAIVMALFIGAGFGALMGSLIQNFKLPPFLVTLAGMFFARSMAFVLEPQSLSLKDPFYTKTLSQDLSLPLGSTLSLPFVALCSLLLFAVAAWMLGRTRFGRAIYAIGGDEESARMMGLPVARTKISIYMLSGLFSAIAGVLYSIYTTSGDPAGNVGFELQAIAAVVIGGTLLTGGVGSLGGTAMGVLILGLIQTLITFQGNLNSWWTSIAVGALVLMFLLLQRVLSSFSSPRKKLSTA
jgi:ribose/xylose/arabinose/galactoside ABC-type transport system permease subunit